MTIIGKGAAGQGNGGWHPLMWIGIATLLLLPLAAMQFTREVAWDAADFAAAAILLIGGGAVYEAATRRIRGKAGKLAVACVLGGSVALIWAQGAVGVF